MEIEAITADPASAPVLSRERDVHRTKQRDKQA
jgi:hypothetical protein